MRSPVARLVAGLVGVLIIGLSIGCAAHGPRNKARVAALTVGDAAVAISQTETQLYAANLYDKGTHDQLGAGIVKVLRAARGYERAAAAWPADTPAPQAVLIAQSGILAALDDLEKIVPQASNARAPLLAALAGLRAALPFLSSATGTFGRPLQSGAPIGGDLAGFLALMQLAGMLLTTGRTTFAQLRDAFKKEGATDEELAAVDAALTAEIERREAEAAAPDA